MQSVSARAAGSAAWESSPRVSERVRWVVDDDQKALTVQVVHAMMRGNMPRVFRSANLSTR
eukprot:679914-Rhodomonas_salina.4